jgi:hypothetical protein
MNKQLFCDIDSTINNHWVRIQKWAMPSFPGTSIDPRAFTRDEILKDLPLPGALDAINRFKELSWDIHYLTARNFHDAYNITRDWLDLHRFPYDTINVVAKSKDKPLFLSTKRCDLFVDDLSAGQEFGPSYKNLYIDTIQQLRANKVKFEIFRGDWNEILDGNL